MPHMARKRKRGGQTKDTLAFRDKVVKVIRGGCHPRVACISCGIDEDTYIDWKKDYNRNGNDSIHAALFRRIVRAEAIGERNMVRQVKCHAIYDGGIAIRLLSKRYRERWGEQAALQVSGPSGGPIEVASAVDLFKGKLKQMESAIRKGGSKRTKRRAKGK